MTSMEDVLPAPEALDLPVAMAAPEEHLDPEPMALDPPDPPTLEAQTVPRSEALEISVPTTTVEVVIEKKEVLEPEDPILPDHYYDNGRIPVFRPTMEQFRNFEKFITRINDYGMQTGIVKVIPPPEWRESLPALDDQVKSIKLKNAIEQQFAGTGGVYRQMNLEKRRVYNLPQWRALCESTDHQPPAKRGEVRTAGHTVGKRKPKPKARSPQKAKMADPQPPPSTAWIPFDTYDGGGTSPTLASNCGNCSVEVESPGFVNPATGDILCSTCGIPADNRVATNNPAGPQTDATVPPLPQIPSPEPSSTEDPDRSASPENIPRPTTPLSPPVLKKRKRRGSLDPEADDEDDFGRFDYRIGNAGEYTVERCRELERIYWKTLTFNSPMYGADMPGSLFDERTDVWNVAKLDNLLCRINKLIPGVNSAYLYLGMWKATFSWHVEDMDLYSINYIHFGAPKQWYSISQCDAEKFERVMRTHFPNDHKGCPQFMRHKTFLASPSTLEQKGITVNRLVHHQGEFVITFPFGYHSGYNLGYNCAESVNFATEEWLDIGRRARKCNCVGDSVNINVDDILDALRGPVEVEEYEDVLTPPDSTDGMGDVKKAKRMRKVKTEPKVIIKIKRFPCMLCPNSIVGEPLLPAGADKFAHRICAEYIPETYLTTNEDGTESVSGIDSITPARWNLKCLYCGSTRGAKFQCSATSCCRAYHATCAAAAGVLVETAEDELGLVSSYQCRFHRPRRPGAMYLEQDTSIVEYARGLKPGTSIQGRLTSVDSDIPFIGTVIENCQSEETVSVELATGELFEVAYKWILAPPKRDVRALCATQSVPGSTKKRQKKKPKVEEEKIQSTSENTAPSTGPPPSTNIPFIPIPQTPVTAAPQWYAKNPGLAQYHEYVSKTPTLAPSSSSTLAAEILQRLQNPPLAPAPSYHIPLPPAPIYQRPPTWSPPLERRDVSAGILFVHSELPQNQAWREQFASQFYRVPAPAGVAQGRPGLPTLLPRPPAVVVSPQPVAPTAEPSVQYRFENRFGGPAQ